MKDDSFIDNFKELISGGYILLFMFGGTICLMASTSLIASFFTDNPAKIGLLAKILDTTIGFMFGAFTTMWNNQHFKAEAKKEIKLDSQGKPLTNGGEK